ncbi:ATP-binding protein [Streptomyces sp. AC627_RSS907]|uniref:sensor histidine kinase n=1 Tax=Streptomyces sp. AC627_RSS907 TaxID=2823684 RepID=UPI0027E5B3C3|nr:ATP-binding protein [Streptomyces sp. AC627_RSS907]
MLSGVSLRGERARLTLLYGGLLVLAGVLLAAGVYVFTQRGLSSTIDDAVRTLAVQVEPEMGTAAGGPSVPPGRAIAVAQNPVAEAAETAALRELLPISSAALGLYAVLSVPLAWWTAGRVLRPVRVITEAARRLSRENLHERIALAGPPGELKELADTFDAMLERLEHPVAAQQRFAAHAAHELRTPLAVQRAAAEIGLAGSPDAARVAHIRERLLEVARDSERMIEGLLVLAASDQGLRQRAPMALDEVAVAAVGALTAEAGQASVRVSVETCAWTVTGDAALLDRLVHNLVVNGIRHDAPGGQVRVRVRTGKGTIEVSDTGPVITENAVPSLFEPFRRGGAGSRGHGLGLSIVASIARAHGGDVRARAHPSPEGGLTVVVRLP